MFNLESEIEFNLNDEAYSRNGEREIVDYSDLCDYENSKPLFAESNYQFLAGSLFMCLGDVDRVDHYYDSHSGIYYYPESKKCWLWDDKTQEWQDKTNNTLQYFINLLEPIIKDAKERDAREKLELYRQYYPDATIIPDEYLNADGGTGTNPLVNSDTAIPLPATLQLVPVHPETGETTESLLSHFIGKYSGHLYEKQKEYRESTSFSSIATTTTVSNDDPNANVISTITEAGPVAKVTHSEHIIPALPTTSSSSRSEITIGRSSCCSIQIPSEEISSNHCAILWECMYFEHFFSLKDLGSANGTFVNGVRISEVREVNETPVLLKIGDIITMGESCAFKVCEVSGKYGKISDEALASNMDVIINEKEEEKKKMHPLEANKCMYKQLRRESYRINNRCKSNESTEFVKAEGKKAKESNTFNVLPKALANEYQLMEELCNRNNEEEPENVPRKILGLSRINAVSQSPIPPSNKGHQLLRKMGWNEGDGIGSTNRRKNSLIEVRNYTGGRGLGFH